MIRKPVEKNAENLQKLKAYAAKWLDYFEAHTKRECFENYILSDEAGERYFEMGLEMDCFESLRESYRKRHKLKDPQQLELKTLLDDCDNPWILGNALFSCWRGITHWAYDSFESFSQETFIYLFRKISSR